MIGGKMIKAKDQVDEKTSQGGKAQRTEGER